MKRNPRICAVTGKVCVYWRGDRGDKHWTTREYCHYLLDEGHSRGGTATTCDKRRTKKPPRKDRGEERWLL